MLEEQQKLSADQGAFIVTGAGSGLGLAIARQLLAAGCQVCAWDRSIGELASFSDPRLTFVELDVRDRKAQIAAAAGAAEAAGGQIAGLVCCAGVMRLAPFLELTEAAFDQTMAINLKGSMLSVQAVVPHMLKAERGSIVLFSSMLARSAGPNAADYIASKGGILGLARSLALDLAEAGIRVNTLSPAIADTPMPRARYSDQQLDSRASANPMGRIATPEDVANAALFLLSEDASFVTGQDLRLTGGARLF